MISLDEINNEIAKLESQPASYASIERLSWFYTVRDHMTKTKTTGEIPSGDTDFMKACSGRSVCQVMEIMDDLMNALLIIQPRLYHAVMSKFS